MINPFLEIYNLVFKWDKTFDSAIKMFHSDYDETLKAWREKGFQDAVDQWDFKNTLEGMDLEDVAEEQVNCAEDIEWTGEFIERAIRRKIKVGLFAVLTDNLALLTLVVTMIMVFGFGFHPFIIAITVGVLAIGDLPYFAVSWFYDRRLLDAYYGLGWNQFEMGQFQVFWQTVVYAIDNMADLDSATPESVAAAAAAEMTSSEFTS